MKKLRKITEGISDCEVLYVADGEYELHLAPVVSYKTNIHAKHVLVKHGN